MTDSSKHIKYLSRKELYDFLEEMPIPVILTETDRSIRYANKQALELGGYEDLTGKKCTETFCGNNQCTCPVNENARLQNSKQLFLKNDRTRIPVLKTAHVANLKEDSFVVQFFTDLTEQVEKAEQLKKTVTEKSEAEKRALNEYQKFETLFDESIDSMFLHDFEGNILKVNKEACRRLGYSKEELTAMHVSEFASEDIINKFSERIEIIRKKGEYQFETTYTSADNQQLHVEIVSKIIDYNNQKVVLSSGRDITVRKGYELQLLTMMEQSEHNEAELKTIFNKVPSTIFIFDQKGRILRMNNKGLIKFKTSLKDVKNRLIGDVINCAFNKNSSCGTNKYCPNCKLIEIIHKAIEKGIETNKKEVNLTLLDENNVINRTILLSTAILNRNGNSTFIATLDDITDRKKMELELLSAKDKAEMSERLKTAFLNNISHEIRTPLNGLLGFLDFFQDDMDEIPLEERKLFIKTMRKSGDRLLHTVEDIIEASKLDSGTVELKKETISLKEIANKLTKNVEERYSECNIKFNCRLEEQLHNVTVESDKSKLLRILRNLIGNAFKFTREGSVTLKITESKTGIKFLVQDTGIGIAKEHLNVIYEPFRQADINMNRAFEGNGLGLTIAHKLCKLLGCDLKVISEPGKGSEFYFVLPSATSVTDQIDYPDENKGSEGKEGLSGKTILIAEDDETNYLYLEAVLSAENCILLHASNGKEAVKLFSENPDIDLVIMDLKMPVMNGIDATLKIKSINNSVPVIAHSAYVLNNEKEQSLAAGCSDYLPKPVKKNELLQTIYKNMAIKPNKDVNLTA